MYIGVDWEVVNSILDIYTTILLPNTCSCFFLFFVIYVRRWM